MVTLAERRESLKRFSPIYLLEYLDEENECSHQLIFYPSTGYFKIISSSQEDLLPVIISYSDFVEGKTKFLNKRNRLDGLILIMMKLWNKTSDEEKIAFCDDVPLNALYLGGQYS